MVCCGGWSAGCCHHWWHSRSPTGPVLCNLIWRCSCQGDKERWTFTPRRKWPTSPGLWVQGKWNFFFYSLWKDFWLWKDTWTWTENCQRLFIEAFGQRNLPETELYKIYFDYGSFPEGQHSPTNCGINFWWMILQPAGTAFIQKSINLNENGAAAITNL